MIDDYQMYKDVNNYKLEDKDILTDYEIATKELKNYLRKSENIIEDILSHIDYQKSFIIGISVYKRQRYCTCSGISHTQNFSRLMNRPPCTVLLRKPLQRAKSDQ